MNKNFIPGPLDASSRLEASATKTADFAGTTLNLGTGFAPLNAGQPMSAIVDSSALDFTTTDETYKFKVQESADGSAWTDASPQVSMTAVGAIAIHCFISQPNVRLDLDVGGTTPSITYEAWIVPLVQ